MLARLRWENVLIYQETLFKKYWISFDEKTLNFSYCTSGRKRTVLHMATFVKQINGAGYVRSGNLNAQKQHKWIEVKQGIFSFVLGSNISV